MHLLVHVHVLITRIHPEVDSWTRARPLRLSTSWHWSLTSPLFRWCCHLLTVYQGDVADNRARLQLSQRSVVHLQSMLRSLTDVFFREKAALP